MYTCVGVASQCVCVCVCVCCFRVLFIFPEWSFDHGPKIMNVCPEEIMFASRWEVTIRPHRDTEAAHKTKINEAWPSSIQTPIPHHQPPPPHRGYWVLGQKIRSQPCPVTVAPVQADGIGNDADWKLIQFLWPDLPWILGICPNPPKHTHTHTPLITENNCVVANRSTWLRD